jgi:hypothetical protein
MTKLEEMRTWSLYQVSASFQGILADLEYMSDDEADEVLACLTDRLEDRALAVAAYELNLRAEAKAVREAEANMRERRQRIERQADRLHKYLQESMQSAAVDLIKCPEYVLRIKKNPPHVEIVDEEMLPPEYMRTKQVIEIDKARIKEDISADMEVPGALLVADFRLEIK